MYLAEGLKAINIMLHSFSNIQVIIHVLGAYLQDNMCASWFTYVTHLLHVQVCKLCMVFSIIKTKVMNSRFNTHARINMDETTIDILWNWCDNWPIYCDNNSAINPEKIIFFIEEKSIQSLDIISSVIVIKRLIFLLICAF